MATYRPRFQASLTVPSAGNRAARRAQEASTGTISIPLKPIRVVLEHTDHNHASSLKLTVPFKDAGFDVRLLANATVTFSMGDADDHGHWDPGAIENVRFVGLLTRITRSMPEDDSRTIDLEFLDFTTILLEQKAGAKGIPHYSMNVLEAWRCICDACGYLDEESGVFTSSLAAMRDRVEFRGMASPGPTLGRKVSSRIAKLAKIPCKPDTDFWAVWQSAVEPLISFIELDKLIVSTSTAYYTKDDPPRLIFGHNVTSMSESRNPLRRRGIILKSFDPASGRTIEAWYPPMGAPSMRQKKVGSKRAGTIGTAELAGEREAFAYDGATDPGVLLEAAHRVFSERSRQELEGVIKTSEMRIERTKSGDDFDLLSLRSGDNIRIELAQDDKAMLASFVSAGESVAAMADYLVARGYDPDLAQLMAQNAADLPLLNPVMYVKSVTTSIDVEGLTFDVEIHYCSRLSVSGDSDVSKGAA